MKDVAREVLNKIDKLKADKLQELEIISGKATEAGERSLQADDAMKAAVAAIDEVGYAKAKNEKSLALAAAEMYSKRYEQLEQKQFVSEAESDRVIDSLLQYENALAADFESAIAEPIKKLRQLNETYLAAVREAETAIQAWTSDIHRNYRSESTTYPDGTNRSPVPVPVHTLPYTGCPTSAVVGGFLEKL